MDRLGVLLLFLGPLACGAQQTELITRAEGFGAIARGGGGGPVIEVTNLRDSGPGSLREALARRGPRIIRFAVAGTIELQSPLVVTEGQVTLDGETAPGQGITLRNHGLHFRGDCKDIIVRHLRIRVTTGGSSGDALLFWGTDGGTVERVRVEHCSLMGATDENVNTWGRVRDVTFQWTIIAEGRPPHSKGWLSGSGSDRITIHHCLFAHNADRNPRVAGGLYDVVNNVIYNWSHHNAAKIGAGARVNFRGNVFLPGPQSTADQACILPEDPEQGTRLYLEENLTPLTPTGAEDQWRNVTWYQRLGDRWIEHRPAPDCFRADKPFTVAPVTKHPAREACELVLSRAGPGVRDADDQRVIEEVRARIRSFLRGPAASASR
ncbi:pectate lyase family protein [Limisphaera sp. VF-2]|jgi:pectate lyase|uniref:pectate lyase family protein n=1 Tax=Limisphaera sp. VF-2 TaxID=3400418 RepID=UPI003C1C44EA